MISLLYSKFLKSCQFAATLSSVSQKAHEVGSIAEDFGDQVTTDIMTEKATFLEKAAWMLQASITR